MQRKSIELTIQGRTFEHLLEAEQQWAIQAAVGAQRPLLVLGEPGVGKTQFAQAAAVELKRPLIRFTVDSNTEATDLLYRYDSVRRLAEAHIHGVNHPRTHRVLDTVVVQDNSSEQDLSKDHLAIDNFVYPGPLWWALNWENALKKAPAAKPHDIPLDWKETDGVVILIDEIDKADLHVPNGLLEVLAENRFLPLGRDVPIQIKKNHAPPLIIITSNQDRVLPPAFVRRCVVLKIELPGGGPSEMAKDNRELLDYLERLGQAHFKDRFVSKVMGMAGGGEMTVYRMVAEQLSEDRLEAIRQSMRPYPGPAEYLDILRAMDQIMKDVEKMPSRYPELENTPKQEIPGKLANELRAFVFKKSNQRS